MKLTLQNWHTSITDGMQTEFFFLRKEETLQQFQTLITVDNFFEETLQQPSITTVTATPIEQFQLFCNPCRPWHLGPL